MALDNQPGRLVSALADLTCAKKKEKKDEKSQTDLVIFSDGVDGLVVVIRKRALRGCGHFPFIMISFDLSPPWTRGGGF